MIPIWGAFSLHVTNNKLSQSTSCLKNNRIHAYSVEAYSIYTVHVICLLSSLRGAHFKSSILLVSFFFLHATPSACTARLFSHDNLGCHDEGLHWPTSWGWQMRISLCICCSRWFHLIEAVRFVVIHSFVYVFWCWCMSICSSLIDLVAIIMGVSPESCCCALHASCFMHLRVGRKPSAQLESRWVWMRMRMRVRQQTRDRCACSRASSL